MTITKHVRTNARYFTASNGPWEMTPNSRNRLNAKRTARAFPEAANLPSFTVSLSSLIFQATEPLTDLRLIYHSAQRLGSLHEPVEPIGREVRPALAIAVAAAAPDKKASSKAVIAKLKSPRPRTGSWLSKAADKEKKRPDRERKTTKGLQSPLT